MKMISEEIKKNGYKRYNVTLTDYQSVTRNFRCNVF